MKSKLRMWQLRLQHGLQTWIHPILRKIRVWISLCTKLFDFVIPYRANARLSKGEQGEYENFQ